MDIVSVQTARSLAKGDAKKYEVKFPDGTTTTTTERILGPADPRDFGAVVGSGVSTAEAAGNTAAFNAAAATGRGLRIPDGEWHLAGEINISGSGYAVIGQGRGRTKLVQRNDNCPIFKVTGSRARYQGMSLTWLNIQNSAQTLSSAFKVVEKTNGGILSNTVISDLDITNCAVGIDLRNSIGYSCRFVSIDIESFAISAIACDSGTAWTQTQFSVFHFANQPRPYLSGTATSAGTTNTVVLTPSASTVNNDYKGMTIVLTGGAGASASTVRFVTAYDGATKTATFYPAASVATDTTTTFSLARQATSSDYPVNFQGFTDIDIQDFAFEFITLPSSANSPIQFTSCQSVHIGGTVRFERIVFGAANSSMIQAAGRTAVVVDAALQTEYSAALTALGVTNIYYGRIAQQATIDFKTAPEANGWQITANAKWAKSTSGSASDRNERPYGGIYFRTIKSGDANLSPVGQDYDHLGPQRQTAILDRASVGARGASLDEGNVSTYNHSLMDRPDIVRFNTPITQDVSFQLDASNQISGVLLTVIRGAGATGSFNINIKYGSTVVTSLTTAGSSVRLYCDGQSYQVVP